MKPVSAEKDAAVVLPYAWVILGIVYLASVVAPFNMSKVPPIMPVIQEHFQLRLSQAGWLMSVFSIIGIFVSLPAGILLKKFGSKAIGVIALLCLCSGSALGAVSGSVLLLMISRVIEGAGMGLMSVMAPAAIADWFPPAKRGIPMGIWATWVPVGGISMSNLAPALEAGSSWRTVWWAGAGFSLVVLCLFLILMKPAPEKREMDLDRKDARDFKEAISSKTIWQLALVFSCYTFVFISIATYIPTFLSDVHGYTLSQAAFIASLTPMVTIGSAPLAGWVSDRIGSRRLFFSIPFLLILLISVFLFRLEGWMLVGGLILLGLIAPSIPATIIAAASEVIKKPDVIGLSLAIVMIGQNLGMFFGPVVFGKLIEMQGWVNAGFWLIPFCLLGFVIAWRVKVR